MVYRQFPGRVGLYKVTKVSDADGNEDFIYVFFEKGIAEKYPTPDDAIVVARRSGFLKDVGIREIRAIKVSRLKSVIIPDDLESKVIE